MRDATGDKIFCIGQQLTLLRKRTEVRRYLAGERFWQSRHPELAREPEAESPWDVIERDTLVGELTAKGTFKRLAVVCAAGLGKSTNLEWLAFRLADPPLRQVPFLFALDDDDELPKNMDEFWNKTLPGRIRPGGGYRGSSKQQILSTLDRYRAQGRLTLLLDSIDQATSRGWRFLRALLKSGDWDECPIVVSARPHAVFERWIKLIGREEYHEAKWRFVHIEPLEVEQRKLLLDQNGHERYRRLPAKGQQLMANPRNIEYVRKLPIKPPREKRQGRYREPLELRKYTLRDLRTASHVFAGAADHMVRLGMAAAGARYLDNPKEKPPPKHVGPREIAFAHDLLGALAYTMYCFPVSKKQKGPNVSHVPTRKITEFHQRVRDRLIAAGRKDGSYQVADLEKDIRALAALNDKIKYDLLDTDASQYTTFRWYDRSLQEFYAALWLSRYADEEDIKHLRKWRYDDPREGAKKSLYEPLWGFLVEMPRAVRKPDKWLAAVRVLFEPQAPRCCEMIYRCWPALSRTTEGKEVIREWREEFRKLLRASGTPGEVARSIPAGFRPCPPNPTAGKQQFWMGSPEGEKEREDDEFQHEVTLSPFQMHQYAVTNAQFELFDPGLEKERWGGELDPAGDEAQDHPVVNMTWFQAWCFARWTSNHLPTEAQWEYACRGRALTYQTFHFGDSISSRDANFDGNHPYGGAKEGKYLGCTTKVGSYPENDFGLYDMHGNVWEWCADWYAADFYKTEKGLRPDPVNKQAASARVLRGGGWLDVGGSCRSACRDRGVPGTRDQRSGFRLAAVPVVGAK